MRSEKRVPQTFDGSSSFSPSKLPQISGILKSEEHHHVSLFNGYNSKINHGLIIILLIN